MSITKEQLIEERKHLQSVLDVIQSKIDHSDLSLQRKNDAITEMKRYIWENGAMLDEVEMAISRYNIDTSITQAQDDLNRLDKLKKSMDSPYFARVDFKEDDYADQIYIGLNGIQDGARLHVFDWRSPVASLFYNYGVGPSSYEAPMGTIEGETILKRQYKIANGVLERCFDSDLNIDDEYLQELLSKSSSEKMTNIVNTIQREQNEIIRNIKDRYLIVQGIAGSGKTSVALHRIAYLLYREENLQSRNVLIFSPNDVFSTYISNVLPELGEDNVLQSTFSEFASSFIRGYDSIENFTSFIDRFYKSEKKDKESFERTKRKLSDGFKKEIDDYIEGLKSGNLFVKGIAISNKYRISAEELNTLANGKYSKVPLFQRLDYITEHICDLNNLSYEKYGSRIRSSLVAALGIKNDVRDLYGELIGDKDFRRHSKLRYEDLIPMMYLFFELNGYPRGTNIKHVIIDEAQDYTLLQLAMLKKIFYNASFTILGDTHQTVNPYYMYDSLENVNRVFNNQGRYIELLKSYRSSEEIIDYSNRILGINNACSIRKSNSVPVMLRSTTSENEIDQLVADINHMKEQGMRKVAIITKNNAETQRLYEALKSHFNKMGKVDETGKIVRGDVIVMPSYISKGLEFDGVIVYTEREHRYKEKDKHLFYVVCTRAQHSLAVYNQDDFSLKREM